MNAKLNQAPATQEVSNANVVSVLESLVNTLSGEQKEILLNHLAGTNKDISQMVVAEKKEQVQQPAPVRVKQPEIDPKMVEKVLHTQQRLVNKEARRMLVERVLQKTCKDRLFTTVEVNELMGSVTSTWDVDPLAELSNIFSEIGCKVVAKQKRESGKGRLVNVWSLN